MLELKIVHHTDHGNKEDINYYADIEQDKLFKRIANENDFTHAHTVTYKQLPSASLTLEERVALLEKKVNNE